MNEVQERQSITSRRAKLDRKLCIGWTVALVLSLALALDSLLTAPGKDLSVYIYVAQGIPSGDVPYLDRWDNKGPLTYLLTLAGKMMGGAYGVWLLGASFLLGSSWFAFKITREAFGLTAALLATTSFLVCFRIVADGGGLTEHYALLFQLLTIYLFFRLSQGNVKRDIPLCLAIGVLGAATFLLRPNLVGLWLTIGLYVAVQHWILGRRDTLRWMPWFVAGGLAILAVTAISFATFNAWSALWDAVFMYNFTYSDATLSDRLSVLLDLRRTLMMVSLPLAAGWCIGLYYLLSGKARGKCYEDILLLGLILLPVETARDHFRLWIQSLLLGSTSSRRPSASILSQIRPESGSGRSGSFGDRAYHPSGVLQSSGQRIRLPWVHSDSRQVHTCRGNHFRQVFERRQASSAVDRSGRPYTRVGEPGPNISTVKARCAYALLYPVSVDQPRLCGPKHSRRVYFGRHKQQTNCNCGHGGHQAASLR